jgi:glycosyltransferase involved in cell wall biosynthesis
VTVLFVANYAPDTGYAWAFIEGLYAEMANRLAHQGVRSLVAFPSLDPYPRSLEGSAAEPIELTVDLGSRQNLKNLALVVRRENVRVVYLTDRETRCLAFRALRRAGVRWIVSHDHTSGARSIPRAHKRVVKRVQNLVPGAVADVVVTVSEYVARRQREVVLIPPDRILTVHNGVLVPPHPPERATTHEEFGVDPGRPIIACACRAHAVKGVPHLLRAFDRLLESSPCDPPPFLLYLGDGPQMTELRALRDRLASREDIRLAGFHPDADRALLGASFFVVPSLWQDALPLSVMEPMARGKPVIASRVGGIPEMIEDQVSGVLVPPGDEAALTEAMRGLLGDPGRAARIGAQAREKVAREFTPERQIQAMMEVVEAGLQGI